MKYDLRRTFGHARMANDWQGIALPCSLWLTAQQYHHRGKPHPKNKGSMCMGYRTRLFGCSLPTANRIKQSGKIDRAITQVGRKIIVDADLALELADRKTGGRR